MKAAIWKCGLHLVIFTYKNFYQKQLSPRPWLLLHYNICIVLERFTRLSFFPHPLGRMLIFFHLVWSEDSFVFMSTIICQYSDRSNLVIIYYEYFCLLTQKESIYQYNINPIFWYQKIPRHLWVYLSSILELHIEFSLEVCIFIFFFTGYNHIWSFRHWSK